MMTKKELESAYRAECGFVFLHSISALIFIGLLAHALILDLEGNIAVFTVFTTLTIHAIMIDCVKVGKLAAQIEGAQ